MSAAMHPARDATALTSTRYAHRYAQYRGDVTASLLAEPLKGPNAVGELLVVLYAHYDPVDDITRAGFTWATTDDIYASAARDHERGHQLSLRGRVS